MQRIILKFRLFSFVLILASLPYILGLHIFQYNCLDCDWKETVARIVTVVKSQAHVCESCPVENGRKLCQKEEKNTCKHEFNKVDFNARPAADNGKIKTSVYKLFFHFKIFKTFLSEHKSSKIYSYVIQYLPDKSLPKLNCTFLL